MATVDIYVSGDGNDTQNGATWANRVKTFTKARAIAAQVGSQNVPRFVIGQFNMAGGINFDQRIGKGIDANDVPDSWLMTAYKPELPWHFIDHTVLNQPNDFVQVFYDSNTKTYNANTSGCPNVSNNSGSPSGTTTGVWVTTRDVTISNDQQYKVSRVWMGGQSLVIDGSAYPSSYQPQNELWEARDFSTLGQDGTHIWTQLSPGESWGDQLLTGTLQSGRLFVFCPKGNPATIWGGVTFLHQRSAYVNGVGFLNFLSIERSAGWHIDPSIKAIGGGLGAFNIRACSNATFEARVDAYSQYHSVVSLSRLNASYTDVADIAIAACYDLRVAGKPYYEIDVNHDTGASDSIQLANFTNHRRITVKGKNTSGSECFIRDPGHSGVGRPSPSGPAWILDTLVIEPGFAVYCGGLQYQRAFVINGNNASVMGCKISGRYFGQRAPSQIDGDVSVIGAEFHFGQQVIPASPDNTNPYPSRFGNIGRNWANLHPDGKNRDAIGLAVNMTGRIDIQDCFFNSIHGASLSIGMVVEGAPVTPDGVKQYCHVSNCTFLNSAISNSQHTAVLVDARESGGKGINLINNQAIGYDSASGAQYIDPDGKRNNIALEALGGPLGSLSGVSRNARWQRREFSESVTRSTAVSTA